MRGVKLRQLLDEEEENFKKQEGAVSSGGSKGGLGGLQPPLSLIFAFKLL
jgi:hypothetical protein